MKLFPEFESLIKQVQDPDQRKLFRNCLKRRVNYLAEALEHKGFIQARLEEKDGRFTQKEMKYWANTLTEEEERITRILRLIDEEIVEIVTALRQQIIDNQMSLSEYPIHTEVRDYVDGIPETKEVEVKLNKQIPQGVFVSTEGRSDLMNFPNGKTDEAFERAIKLSTEVNKVIDNHPTYKDYGMGASYEGDERDPDEIWRCFSLYGNVEEGQPFTERSEEGKCIRTHTFQVSTKGRVNGELPEGISEDIHSLLKFYEQPQVRIWSPNQQNIPLQV